MLGLGKEHHLAAGAHRVHCGLNERIDAHGQDHGICSAAIRGCTDAINHAFSSGLNGLMESEPGRDGVALGITIRGQDARAGAAGESCQHQADGALANDQHCFVGGKIEQLDSF